VGDKTAQVKINRISNSTKITKYFSLPSRWPSGLRRRSAEARLLGLGFESCRGHGCLSSVNVVFCAGTALCDGPIPRVGESYRLCVNECDQM
jgi:hypothetical protein